MTKCKDCIHYQQTEIKPPNGLCVIVTDSNTMEFFFQEENHECEINKFEDTINEK